MRVIKIATLTMLLVPFIFTGCSKNDNKTTQVQVRLTDAPADYDAIYIDVERVEIHSNEDGWVTLNTQTGIYNLLDLTNGKDTLIASNELPSGTISQIRLVLGPNNTIVVDSVTHPLETPSAMQSGLKLQLHDELQPDVTYVITLDFDAARSIVETGNGNYQLKPVIRTIHEGIDGVIHGMIDPAASAPVVYAITGTDTFTTYADTSGFFLIRGLQPATYKVDFEPVSPYKNKSITGVSVTKGNVSDLGTVQITQ